MARPATTPFAEDVYAMLAPAATRDEAAGWPLLTLVAGASLPFRQVEQLWRSTDPNRPPGANLLDVDAAPDFWLPWLGQTVGVSVTPNVDAASQRAQIRGEGGFKRGRVDTLRNAVAATLGGTQSVSINERAGGIAGNLIVTVLSAEVMNLSVTTAAAQAAKAAGRILTIVDTNTNTYASFEAAHTGTYATVDAAYATYAASEA